MQTIMVNDRKVYLNQYQCAGQKRILVHTARASVDVGSLMRTPRNGWLWRTRSGFKWNGHGKELTRKQAATALLEAVGRTQKRREKARTRCTCRKPKRHHGCAYCGYHWYGWEICGVCREAGIDGNVIRGTSRVVCRLHKDRQK